MSWNSLVNTDIQKRIAQLGIRFEDWPQELVTVCALCGQEEDFAVLADRDRYGFPVRTLFCRRCGFAFLSPRLTTEGYAQFYDRYYRPLLSAFKGREVDVRSLAERQIGYAERLDRVVLNDFLTRGAHRSLLDIGGSTGTVSQYFAVRYGLDVTVLDPSPVELEAARERGLKTVQGVIEDFTTVQPPFDVILMVQTVGHLQNINTALSRIHALSHEGTLIFIDIVDFLAICRLRSYSIPDATQIDHPNSVIEPVMRAFFDKHGFKVVLTDYSRTMYTGFVLRAVPERRPLPEQFPYVEPYLRELVMITNSKRPTSADELIGELSRRVRRRVRFWR